MEKIIIRKERVMTNITEHLNDVVVVRNRKAKTYHYTAKLLNYKTAKDIDRVFHDVTDLERNGGWSVDIQTEFLNNLEIGEIIEVGINLKASNNYSNISKSYFLILENNEESLTVLKTKTPKIAFTQKSKIFN